MWRATLLVMFVAAAVLPAHANEHLKLFKRCLEQEILVTEGKVRVYGMPRAGKLSLRDLRCVFPESIDFARLRAGNHAATYPSKVDHSLLGDGPPRPLKEAVIRVGKRLMVVTAPSSDRGVTRARVVDRSEALVEVGEATGVRTFLLDTKTRQVDYLTNGHVEAVESGFRVEGRKSYFRNVGGAFWFDALLNSKGQIVDIVTPPAGNVCMSRKELARRSRLELGKVKSTKVCVKR